MGPEFLTTGDVLEIHADQIERYGGSGALRDAGLLDAAVAMPQASFGGALLHADLFEMAAAYLYHVVQNHPFVDGNKRAGTAAALTFLDLNGVEVDIGDEDLVALVLKVAQGAATRCRAADLCLSTWASVGLTWAWRRNDIADSVRERGCATVRGW